MSEGTVNSQIVDSVANVVTLASATAPARLSQCSMRSLQRPWAWPCTMR
jgi:hypothetical protein